LSQYYIVITFFKFCSFREAKLALYSRVITKKHLIFLP
jgi:hypothetical protein